MPRAKFIKENYNNPNYCTKCQCFRFLVQYPQGKQLFIFDDNLNESYNERRRARISISEAETWAFFERILRRSRARDSSDHASFGEISSRGVGNGSLGLWVPWLDEREGGRWRKKRIDISRGHSSTLGSTLVWCSSN